MNKEATKQKTRLLSTENKLVVTRGMGKRGGGRSETDEGD